MSWVYLSIAIIAEVIATSALKASDGFTKLGPLLLCFAGYGMAFYFMSMTLKTIPVGITYAIWAGAGIVLITVIGIVLFKEELDLAAFAGIGLIVAGVAVIHLFSKAAP